MESGQAYLPGGEDKLVSGVWGLLGWEVGWFFQDLHSRELHRDKKWSPCTGQEEKKRKRNVPFTFPDLNTSPGGIAALSFVLPIDLVHALIAALIMLVTIA